MSAIWFHHRRKVVLACLILVSLTIAGATLAQQVAPPTEPGATRSQALDNSVASYDSATSTDLPPDENPPPGSSRLPNAPTATFHYFTVAGATLRGRSSTTNYAYDSTGCIHLTSGSGSNLIVNTELHIPDNSVIKYLRVIYADTSNTGGVAGYLTRYRPGEDVTDIAQVSSTNVFTGGVDFAVSQEITETVNNTDYAYTLIGWPDAANVNLKVCGLRVAYYLPTTSAFLPTVLK